MSVTSLRKTDRDDKRELILDEASAQFNERGFHDTRLEDIAEALGATKASISYHFQSKRALLEAAYERTCDFLDKALAEAASGEGRAAKVRHWTIATTRMQAAAQINAHSPLAFLNDLTALDPSGRDRIEARITEQFATLEGFLEKGRGNEGETRSAALLLWTLPGWVGEWLDAIPPRRHARQIDLLGDLLVAGLACDEHVDLRNARLPQETANAGLLFNRQERARLKRDAFERAGTRNFNERGYAGFSLNALTDELGASRGTFYYTFADKDELLEACARRSHERLLELLDAVADAPGPMIAKIHAALTTLYASHFSNLEPLLRRCILSSLPRAKEAVANADWQNIAARMARLLAECREEGGCRDTGIERLELLLLAALRNIAISPGLAGLPGGSPFKSAAAAAYFAPLFTGLRGASGAAN